jgi:hypothetical protein
LTEGMHIEKGHAYCASGGCHRCIVMEYAWVRDHKYGSRVGTEQGGREWVIQSSQSLGCAMQPSIALNYTSSTPCQRCIVDTGLSDHHDGHDGHDTVRHHLDSGSQGIDS